MKYARFFVFAIVFFFSPFIALASDRSDAEDLMKKCEAGSKSVEIPVRNFGQKEDIAAFENGLSVIKQGKVKLLQSRFLEAKAKFAEYLKIEYELYGKLSPAYMERAREMIDKIAEDLVDFATRPEVLKAFTDAARSMDEAKMNQDTKKYLAVVQSCRVAKNQVLNAYGLAKKEIPSEYRKDAEDNGGKIFTE